jgi:hypothetical protein
MNEYRVVYEKKRKEKDPLHILPDMEFAPDLFPDQGRRNRDLFAIAMAFGYIVQVGSYYYFDPDRGHQLHKINPGREYRLGQGREKAEEAFSRRNEWVLMVDEKVEAEIRKVGNEEAIAKLEAVILGHLTSMSKMSGDDVLRKQFEREVAALKAKQRDLGKID